MLRPQQRLCCYASPHFAAHIPGMVEGSSPAAAIRTWMLGVLKDTGWSPAAWASKAGVAGSTVQRAIKPTYEFVTSSRTLAKLAAAAGADPPDVRKPAEAKIVPTFLPVRYRAQAGNWIEIDTEEPIDDFDYAVAPNPHYAEWPQWLELVVGDSINIAIPDRHLAHVVDAFDMGYEPHAEDYVVAERRRDSGRIRERTIKQVEIAADGTVELWPRSTNPKWSTPVLMREGSHDGEEIEVFIVGLVIGAYNPTLLRRR